MALGSPQMQPGKALNAVTNGLYNFYTRPAAGPVQTAGIQLADCRIVSWVPTMWRIIPFPIARKLDDQRLLKIRHLVFFWLHHCFWRIGHNRYYRVLLIFHGQDLAHFSVVRTRDYRFPFMLEDDVQIGPVWTHPSYRGKGLANGVLAHLLPQLGTWRRVWWICLRGNGASNRVALKNGFSLAGTGVRTKRWGLRALGTFVETNATRESADFATITETPGLGATRDQLSILYTRYHLAASFAKGKDVLEAACGAGTGLGYLARAAKRVVGGDIDENNLRVAKKTYDGRARIVIERFDAQSMPFPNRSFDVVILFEALYYLPDAESFLREAYRVLRPRGTLLISSVHSSWPGFNPSPYSRTYYNHRELAGLLTRHGFDPTLYAGFPETTDGLMSKGVRRLRRLAVRLHLFPRTMKGKNWLKRLFYGKLAPIPREVTEAMARLEPLTEICRIPDPQDYRMIYAIARKCQESRTL